MRKKADGESNGHADAALDAVCMEITSKWRRSIEDWIAIGDELLRVKHKLLVHGDFLPWVDQMKADKRLPFGQRVAQMMMAIASNEVIRNPKNFAHLPCCYLTLATLAAAPEIELLGWIRNGKVNSETQQHDVRRLLGWQNKGAALKALSVLFDFMGRVTAKELAEYCYATETQLTLFGLTGDLDALRQLPAYLTELHADLEARYEAQWGPIHYGQAHVTKREKKRNELKQEQKKKKEEADATATQTR